MKHNANGPILVNTNRSAPFVEGDTLWQDVLRRPLVHPSLPQQSIWKRASAPVKWERMALGLKGYPDQQMARLLSESFRHGFVILPFEGDGCKWVKNLKAADI